MKNIDKTREQFLIEIEQLKAKNAELEKNKEMFQLIAESTSDNIAITTFDLKAKYIYVSPSVKRVLGYDPKDLLGKSFFDFIHPADKKVLLPLIKKYIKSIAEKVFKVNDPTITETIEFRFKHKARKWYYMQSTVNFIGKNLLAVTRDITERKQAEEVIINSEKKFRILTESAPIGIYYSDQKGNFLYGNKKAEAIIGYKQDELVGKNFLKLKLLDPKHILKAVKLLALNKLGKSTGPDYFTLNSKDGTQKHVEISTEIINIEEQEVVLGMVQDITERKKAEEELKQYAKIQKVLVREVNHRVKNNLSAIIGMLHKEQDREKKKGVVSIDFIGNLEKRIRGLLTVHSMLSKSGWQPIKLTELCRQIVNELMQKLLLSRKVVLNITESTVLISSTQAHYLTLVLVELATNSVKYSLGNRKNARVNVDIKQNKNNIQFSFCDDGAGYPKEILDGDFSKSGIGLELIKGIVEYSLGGKVEISNDNGAKTIINFENEIENNYNQEYKL